MVRFKRILCPVDFFKASASAFDYAIKLAVQYDAKVHVIHVVAPLMPEAYVAPLSTTYLPSDLEKEAKHSLQKFRSRAAKARVDVTTEVRLGDVTSGILRAAEIQKADLVVLGTHGRRGFERLVVLGPGKKARTTPPNIRRILLTTDFSDGTADAVAYALSIAQECQARVTLLHVLHDLAADVAGKYREPLLRGIESQLQKLIPESALDWCDVETRIEEGLPFRVIAQLVQSGTFDLLVMNIHGKSMLDRALIGSTAERTLRVAAGLCPVLLIPPLGKSKAKRRRKS